MIVGGIVLYYPNVRRLEENICSIKPQVDKLILFNNGSELSQEVRAICKECILIDKKTNIGIAAGLNEICKYADKELNADWVLTLDQDSICPENLVSEYSKFMDLPDAGILCPQIHDMNFGKMGYDSGSNSQYDCIEACITSASLMRISAWKEVGGFWDGLFIDMVDFDICWSLVEHGYKIYRINSVALRHEIGHGREVSFRGQKAVAYNHTPVRDYYIIRNNILVGKKHGRLSQCIRWGIKRFMIIMRFEDNRWIKAKYMVRGMIHGIIGRTGGW